MYEQDAFKATRYSSQYFCVLKFEQLTLLILYYGMLMHRNTTWRSADVLNALTAQYCEVLPHCVTQD